MRALLLILVAYAVVRQLSRKTSVTLVRESPSRTTAWGLNDCVIEGLDFPWKQWNHGRIV